MRKFNNKYRSEPHRLPNWNYSTEGMYFLTIVTQHRVCNLGTITGGTITLSEYGKIVDAEWHKSFDIRRELFLDEYVIMPNHIHAIVIIDNNLDDTHDPDDPNVNTHGRAYLHDPNDDTPVNTHGRAYLHAPNDTNVNTHGRAYQHDPDDDTPVNTHGRAYLHTIKRNPPIRLPKSISSFMAGFKSSVNSKIDDYIDANRLNVSKYNRSNHFFLPNYYDHIIRNDEEYHNIKNYINLNPQNWQTDKLSEP